AARHQYLGARTPRRVDTTHPALWWDFSAPSTQVVVVRESLSENTITSFREMRQRKFASFCTEVQMASHRTKKCSADAERQRLERVVGVRFGALRGVERWRLGDIYRDAGNANPDLRLMRTSD